MAHHFGVRTAAADLNPVVVHQLDGDVSIKLIGQPLDSDPLRPFEHQNGGHGARELPAGAGVSADQRDQHRRGVAAELIAKTIFRHLERGVALHAQWGAADTQGGVSGHGCHRWPSALRISRRVGETLSNVSGRAEDPDSAPPAGRNCSRCLQTRILRTIEFADDDNTLFFRIGPSRADQPQAHRTVSQLRGGHARATTASRGCAQPRPAASIQRVGAVR